MKKLKLLTVLLSVFMGASVLAVSSCAMGGSNTTEIEMVLLDGFDVEQSITVDAGSSVLVDIPIVVDQDGNPVDVIYDVTDKNGGAVTVTANRFFAVDENGYYINYAIFTADGVLHEKKTVVNVVGKASLYAEYETMVDVGEETTITPVSDFENPTYEYTVTYKETGEELPVTDGTFVAEVTGYYTVGIVATDGDQEATYEYEIYCREKMAEGEIERFGSDWEQVRALSSVDTFDWQLATTAETGIRDRFGREATFAKMVTSAQYGYFWINPRGDEAYYRQLAEEGYTHVSFWIYSAGQVKHDVISQLYPEKGAYTANAGTVAPGVWTEIKIRLVENYNDYSGSFSAAVDYFKKQQTHILCFDNTAGWNSGGHEEDMTIYISDVYAVKPAEIKAEAGAKLDYVTGDTVNLDDIVSVPEGIDVQYNLKYRGNSEFINSSTYTFNSNGVYQLDVIPTPNIQATAQILLTVTDGVVSNLNDKQIERTEDSVSVDFSSLGIELMNGDVAVPVTGYKVYSYGREVATENGVFTTSIDGCYTVEVEGEYELNGKTYKTYSEISLDVWSEKSKFVVTYNDLMLAHSEYCGWNNWDPHPTYESGTYSVGGEEGRMLRVVKRGSTYLVLFKPMYSKGYYENLLAEYPEATVTMKYYVLSDKTGGSIRSYFDNFDSKGFVRNQWVIGTMSLSDFVASYEKMSTGYDEVKYLMDYNITKTHSRSEKDFLFWFNGNATGDVLYVPDIVITMEAEEGVASLKNGAELRVNETNDLTSLLDVKLNGQTAKIEMIGVQYGDDWISLTDKTFKPVFGGEYTFRIYATCGAFYKVIECTVATTGEVFVRTDDTTVYTIQDGEDFDLSRFIKDGYEIEYTVERVMGSTLEAVDVAIQNNVLTTEALGEQGYYKITVTLVADKDFVFGSFLYYTLNVNYVGGEPEYVIGTEHGATYLKMWNNWNSATAPYAVATVADSFDENVAGKKGAYFKADVAPRWATDVDPVGVQVIPVYSKAYYESLLADGKNYSLTFEWKYVSTYEYAEPLTGFRCGVFGEESDRYSQKPNTWYKESIDLQTILDNWDTLTATGKVSARNLRELVNVRVHGGSKQNEVVGTLYIGNFRIAKPVEIETGVKLIDGAEVTTYDFTALYKDVVTTATYTAVLTDVNGNEISVSDAKSFELGSVKQGVYKLELLENGVAVYGASIDIYNSNDGLVWQEIDETSVNDSQAWKHGYTNVGATTFAVKDGKNVLQFTTVNGDDANTNGSGIRVRAIHSYEYYVMMAEKYESITFDVHLNKGANVKEAGNTKSTGGWQSAVWKTYTVPVQFFLDNWLTLNNLVDKAPNADCSLLLGIWYGEDGKTVVSVGNFGCVAKESVEEVIALLEIEGMQLIETSATPTYNFLSLDTEGVLNKANSYSAVLTAPNGRVVKIADATKVATAEIPQGVYTVVVKTKGVDCIKVTVDIYTAADGLVWQSIDEYSVNDSRAWKHGYINVGETTTTTIDGKNVVQFTVVKAGEGNTNGSGIRIRAIHSKEYYQMMAESYESITIDVHVSKGMNIKPLENANSQGNWHATGWKTYTISVKFLLDNWDSLNNLNDNISGLSADYTAFVRAWWGGEGDVVSVGNFGSVAKS